MKKKLLFILPKFPYPLTDGGNQAVFNSILAAKDCFDVSIIFVNSQKKFSLSPEISIFFNTIDLIPYKYSPIKNFLRISCILRNRIASLLKIEKKDENYKFETMPEKFFPISSDFVEFVNNYIVENNIEVVQMEMIPILYNVLTLPPNVIKIFIHHEIRFIVNMQRLCIVGITAYRKAMVELAKILEIGFLNKCDAVITLSNLDKNKLIDAGVNVPIYTSFAVVNTNTNISNNNESSNTLSFIGPSSHNPNYLGVKWFLENCWNALLEKDCLYKLKIIGNWSEDKQKELLSKYKNIEFAGFVPNLAEALNDTIMIVPITVGSGIRMKILEAACLGIPFVGTTIGAEGLPFESGRDCLKGDTPKEFIDSILKMRDKKIRDEMAINANILVKKMYSMEAFKKNRFEIYKKILENRDL